MHETMLPVTTISKIKAVAVTLATEETKAVTRAMEETREVTRAMVEIREVTQRTRVVDEIRTCIAGTIEDGGVILYSHAEAVETAI